LRDVKWCSENRAVAAVDKDIYILTIPEFPGAIVLEPLAKDCQHLDTIRELAVSEPNPHLILSGGFDTKVFVSDLDRLGKGREQWANGIYHAEQVISSVRWSSTETWLASCTADEGTIHFFDIRANNTRVICNTNKLELYTHAYLREYNIALGFGDGTIQCRDQRKLDAVLSSIRDPYMTQIGEIVMNAQSNVCVVFGVPVFTLWEDHGGILEQRAHGTTVHATSRIAPVDYKTSGQFIAGTSLLAVADVSGVMTLFDLA